MRGVSKRSYRDRELQGVQGVVETYRKLQGVTGSCRELQVVSGSCRVESYMELLGVTGRQGATESYRV